MVRWVAVLAFISACLAQSVLPQNWAGFGGAFNGSSKPPVAGWMSYALLINKESGLYSISSQDVFLSQTTPHVVQTSTRTGVGLVMRSMGPIVLMGLGDAGVSTGGTNVGSAFSGGGLAILKLGKTNWTMVVGTRVLKTATTGTQTIIEIGWGRVF